MKLLFFVAIAVSSSLAAPPSICHTVLQENIDFTKIGGKWYQYRYSSGTLYEDTNCYSLEIFGIDETAQKLHMKSSFQPPMSIKKGMAHEAFTSFVTTASWGEKEEGKEYIGDHLASDYENYLIFYQCNLETGQTIVDLELKDGVSQLSAIKVEEVEDLLHKIGVRYDALTQVDQTACPFSK